MKRVLLVALLTLTAFPKIVMGADDAPIVTPTIPLLNLQAGDVVPDERICYTPQLHIDTAKRVVYCETFVKEVTPHVGMATWKVVMITVSAVLVTAAVVTPIAYEAGKTAK